MQNPLEVPHLRVLEAELDGLAKAFNHNSELFQHGLTIAEMRIRVLERAMHDQLRGCLKTKTIEDQLEVDFEAYVIEFAACMAFSEFATSLAKLQTEKPSVIVTPGYEDVQIFGGD